jgi:hypothetical protein
MSNLIIGLSLLLVAQTITWFATNGQFLWPFFKENPLFISLTFGTFSCYLFIIASKYSSLYFNSDIWPIRILSFCIGIASFSVLTWFFLNETLSAKTIVCLALSFLIMIIQVLWK